MIIFDLDGTLANCEHRRHFITPPDKYNCICKCCEECRNTYFTHKNYEIDFNSKWKPDWKAFYEACDMDEPIVPVINLLNRYLDNIDIWNQEVGIWSGRCESVKEKTIDWLEINIDPTKDWEKRLKMRQIGDNTPDDQLKEKWLDELIEKSCLEGTDKNNVIEMVFDDRPKVIRMWRKRGIFVFNCCQHDEEF